MADPPGRRGIRSGQEDVMAKPKLTWQGPWADAAYRKKHLRKATIVVAHCHNNMWWSRNVAENSLSSAIIHAMKKARGEHLSAIVTYDPHPPTTIAIIEPEG